MDGTPSPHILITRLSHIGDCLLTLPLAVALKEAYPQSRLTWAVESPTHKLLALHPAIDELLQVPKGWLGKPTTALKLRQQLRKRRFDLAIDPQGITKSAALGWLSGARLRIGIRGQWGRELSPWLNNRLVTTTHSHLVDRTLQLLGGLPEPPQPSARGPQLRLPLDGPSQQRMQQWLAGESRRRGITRDRWVMINPGGSWASKRWVMDRFGVVAQYLLEQHQLHSLVVWAGDEERQMAETIQRVAPQATTLAPPTSLTELAALAAQCRFFLGGDTGPLHLAVASGTPCIGLYGPTRPEDSGAYGREHLAVQKWYQAGSCRERRQADNLAMRDITTGDVFAACEQMVSRLASGQLADERVA